MAYANPSTFVAGEVLTAAQQNVLANNDRFLHGPPMVRVTGTAGTTAATVTYTAVVFNTEAYDSDTMWSSTAATRIDINTAGKYMVGGAVQWSDSTVGTFRELAIRRSGGANDFLISSLEPPPETGHIGPWMMVSALSEHMTSTQYFELMIRHDVGVNHTITPATARNTPQFWAIWMSS